MYNNTTIIYIYIYNHVAASDRSVRRKNWMRQLRRVGPVAVGTPDPKPQTLNPCFIMLAYFASVNCFPSF